MPLQAAPIITVGGEIQETLKVSLSCESSLNSDLPHENLLQNNTIE